MQAVQLDQNGGPLQIRRIPVPGPGPGEVLIRMAASPINPSDLGFLSGGYGETKSFPVVPGLEGSGMVVAAGSGLLPNFLVGKRVACTKSPRANGAWAEYMVTRASACVPLRRWISLEQGAMLVVNPLTALAFFEIAKQGRHAAIVNSAAASQLGRMLLRLSSRRGVPLVNIVRRQEQAELLFQLGARHVLVSRDPDFREKLRSLAHELRATLILDAVAGELTQQLIDAAPQRSLILLYSILSGEPARINPNSLWYDEKRIEGFHLATWAKKSSFLSLLKTAGEAQRLAGTDLQTTVHKRIPLSSIQEAVESYKKNMTAGKILLINNPANLPIDEAG